MQFKVHVVLLAVEGDLQRFLLAAAKVAGYGLNFVVVVRAGLEVYAQRCWPAIRRTVLDSCP